MEIGPSRLIAFPFEVPEMTTNVGFIDVQISWARVPNRAAGQENYRKVLRKHIDGRIRP